MEIAAEERDLPGLMVLQRRTHRDERGSFSRVFCEQEFARLGLPARMVQINYSRSEAAGTLRGFHFQYPPSAEAKLVTCVAGEIFDVALDLRPGSPTFLRAAGVRLRADDHTSVLVPAGCAHAHLTLVDASALVYAASAAHDPAAEDGVRFDDPSIDVAWPRPPVTLSDKDRSWPDLAGRLVDLTRRMRGPRWA